MTRCNDQNILFRSTYEIIQKEVRMLSEDLSVKTPQALSQAYETGGQWHDNPHWEYTMHDQERKNRRLRDLRAALQSPIFIEELSPSCAQVVVGTTVETKNMETGMVETFGIVGPVDITYNPRYKEGNFVSYQSPVGRALLGKRKGEIAIVKLPETPLQTKRLSIIDIKALRAM